MMVDRKEERRRSVADFLVIATGVALIGFAVWGAPLAFGERPAGEIRSFAGVWLIYILAGTAVLTGMFVGERAGRRPLLRGLLIVAVLVLAGGLLFLRDFGPRALVTLALPAVILLAAVPFVGPVPPDRTPSEVAKPQ